MLANKGYLWSGSIRIHDNLHINRIDILCVCVLMLATIIALLWNYETAVPLQFWDESRNANNALEMVFNNSWLVPTYNELPDHWNTKPPLLIWMMALGMKLGLSPLLAVRLPSVFAVIATLGIIWFFLNAVLKSRLGAVIACVLILSSTLYMGVHGAHTGDYDVMLALFTTVYVLSFWCFVASKNTFQFKYLVIAAIFIVLAVLTKGIAGLFGLMGLVIFCVVNGVFLNLISNWKFWLIFCVTFILCITYYLVREFYDHGYLKTVWINELGGRYLTTIESHYNDPLFYIKQLGRHFEPGFIFILCLPLLFRNSEHNSRGRSLAKMCFLVGLALLILLSIAKTQLEWYAIPIVPLWSITAAIALSGVIVNLKRKYYRAKHISIINALVIAILVLLMGSFLYKAMSVLPNKAARSADPNRYGNFFSQLHLEHLMPKQLTVIDSGIDGTGYNPVLSFYARLEKKKGITIHVSGIINYQQNFIASCDKAIVAEIKKLQLVTLYDNNICVMAVDPII